MIQYLDDFLGSCSSACEVIFSMGRFIVIQPKNIAAYLMKKKSRVLYDFIEFCELGEFKYMLIINEWFGVNIPH
jgi:predicted small integral membrane protein